MNTTYATYIQANRSLEIPDITIRRFINGQTASFNRSKLDVFYIPESDVFLLYNQDFRYLLSRNTFAMIIMFQDQGHRSYMLPNIDGHYLLELKAPQNPALIANFETILRNYSHVDYRSGQEQQIPVQPQVQVPVQQKHKYFLDWSNEFTKASKYLKEGGENLKFRLINASNKVGTKETENINPNQVTTEKTLEELKTGIKMVYLPRDSMNSLFATTREIEAMSQSQVVRNVQPSVQGSPWNELKRATLDSATNVWQGMEVAATNLFKALKTKTDNKIANKKIPFIYKQQYTQQYQPQSQPQYQQSLNPTGLDSTRDPLSRSQSVLIQEDYQRLDDNSPVLPNTTAENQVVSPTIPANTGLYPHLSGPFGVRDTRIENNGLNYVPYAQSQVYVSPVLPNEDKKL